MIVEDADEVPYVGQHLLRLRYEWIVEGLRLYDALEHQPVEVIECFPTASWTRWHGARGARRRAAWTREGLVALGLDGVPSRTNQDGRDAIAAALSARDYEHGRSQPFGAIVVPAPARADVPPTAEGVAQTLR